jgi:hypothetical protein
MTTTHNDYRIDILPALSDHQLKQGKKYHIPCGMSTIFYLSSHTPRRSDILNATSKLEHGQVAVVSYYDYKERDYRISSVIDSLHSY